MRKLVALALVLAVGGVAVAGPFFRCNVRSVRNPTCLPLCLPSVQPCRFQPILELGSQEPFLTSAMPVAESKEEVQTAQAPSLPPVRTEPSTSPVPAIVGEKRPDAGSPSLIGKLLPDGKIEINPPDLGKLDLSKLPQPKVSISVPLKPETSESLEALAPRLHTLLTFMQVVLGIFGVGKAGPWVLQAGSGLLSFTSALSKVSKAMSSGQVTASPPVTQAEAATTKSQATSSA